MTLATTAAPAPQTDEDIAATLARLREDLLAQATARHPGRPAGEVAAAVDDALASFRGARFADYLPVLADRRVEALLRALPRR